MNDYLSINNKLIDGDLKQLLHEKSSVANDIDFLYSKFQRRRTICARLPFKSHETHTDYNSGYYNYMLLINRFNDNGNVNIKKFLIIYNGVINLFLKTLFNQEHNTAEGFDYYLHEINSKETEMNVNLSDVCQMYILEEIAKITNDPKTSIFGEDTDELNRLSKYCVQDIKLNENLAQCLDVYKMKTTTSVNHDYGIAFFVINRLAFVIFHDLMCLASGNNTNRMMFPDLDEFYKCFYNFSVYIHCYVHRNGQHNDLFYIKEYYHLRDALYKTKNSEYCDLKNFNYLDTNQHDGTLLHVYIHRNLEYLVEMALKDGFDCYQVNKHKASKTPLQLALRQNDFAILALLNKMGVNTMTDNNKNNDNSKRFMDDKSLELRYNSFTNQYICSMYFLKKLGFNEINRENEIQLKETLQHKSYERKDEDGNIEYVNHFSDDLYRGFDDMIGLNCDKTTKDDFNRNDVMYGLITTVMSMLEMKLPFCDDFLILVCIFCNQCIENSKSNEKMVQLSNQFFNLLNSIITDCLTQTQKQNKDKESSNDEMKEKDTVSTATMIATANDSSYFKTRNYIWFKTFFLHSNIWFVKKNKSIMFDIALEIVEKELIKQKQFIWNNIENARKENDKAFVEMCQFGGEYKKMNKINNIRQDKISNGIVSKVNELETILMRRNMGDSQKDFNIRFENNTKIYLTQCLTFAHSNNESFQKAIKSYFENFQRDTGIECKYQAAPVKLYDRCVVKGTSDYQDRRFPSVANIVDFMRFSVSFETIEDLLQGLNRFINDINSGKNKDLKSCLVPNGILRIKNGFSSVIDSWKSYQDAEYCDIKLNLRYTDSNGNGMIVEAQFLLSFLLKAKKMGHKLYRYVFYIMFFGFVSVFSGWVVFYIMFFCLFGLCEKHDVV